MNGQRIKLTMKDGTTAEHGVGPSTMVAVSRLKKHFALDASLNEGSFEETFNWVALAAFWESLAADGLNRFPPPDFFAWLERVEGIEGGGDVDPTPEVTQTD